MSRLPRSGGATAAGWGCLPLLFGGCGVAGSAFSPKAELTRSTAGGSGCSLVALVAGSLRDGLPWAVGRRVRYIMTWAGNLHRWPRRSSLPPLFPSSGLSHGIAPGAGVGLDWIGCTVSGWVWLVCWPGLAAGGVAGWGCCGFGGGLPAPLLLRRSCSPAGLRLCLYGRGLLRAAVWPCSCWPAAWRCRLRWAGWALGWHDLAGLVGWGRRFLFVILHKFTPCISSLFTPLCQVSNS